jgi:hypothetical protein
MSLIDELREIEHFPPSHAPSLNEVLEIVGKLAAYAEHGDELLKAAQRDAEAREKGEPASAIDELLSPPEPEPEPAPSPPAVPPSSPSSRDDRDDEIAELRQQVATLRAAQQRTTAAPTEPPPSLGATPPDVRG